MLNDPVHVSFFSFQDDSFSQLRSITCQLKEMEEDRNRIEARLQQLQRSLGEAEEGNCFGVL